MDLGLRGFERRAKSFEFDFFETGIPVDAPALLVARDVPGEAFVVECGLVALREGAGRVPVTTLWMLFQCVSGCFDCLGRRRHARGSPFRVG